MNLSNTTNTDVNGKQHLFSALRARASSIMLALVIVLAFLLATLSCKNISHGLLWSDESETIMYAQQVTQYGYPKVHDNQNLVFIPDNALWLGYKPSHDAYITMTWGSFYYGAIGVWLAHYTTDIYLKTALVRLPFAIAGLTGLLIFAFSLRGLFRSKVSFRLFLAVFLVFEMLSVNMLLHIREARYYPLVILITACYFYVFVAYHFQNKYARGKYITLITAIVFMAYNINVIAFTSIFAATGLYQCITYINYKTGRLKLLPAFNFKESLILISPLLISLLLILPELIFFENFRNAALADAYYQNGIVKFADQLVNILAVMLMLDLLPAMLVIKILRARYDNVVVKNGVTVNNRIKTLKLMSFFMLLFFTVYILVTSRMPYIFTRYFITLQPVIILILLTDVVIMLEYAVLKLPVKSFFSRKWILVITGAICLADIALSDNHISDYLYQATHPYRGPLDYYIPAIQARFKHPENIVIATNYEEMSYEYYLGSKVILGYRNHFREFSDSALSAYSPDVIIMRPEWKQNNQPYQYYLQHANYEKISFPVQDWQVNNVPDLFFRLRHRFNTHTTELATEEACMYVKAQP